MLTFCRVITSTGSTNRVVQQLNGTKTHYSIAKQKALTTFLVAPVDGEVEDMLH